MKVYMIVTNDIYEEPIQCDIVGQKAVADYIGCSVSYIWRHLKINKWDGKYKVIDMGFICEQESEFEPNKNIKPLSEEERNKRVANRKKESKEKRRERRKLYDREYYQKNKEAMIGRMKKRYEMKKDIICAYGRQYRKEVKEGKRYVNQRY